LSAAAVFIVCFGGHTPLFSAAHAAHLPLPLRFPERFAVTAAFLLLVAGGLGIDAVLSDDRWWRATRYIVIGAALSAALLAFFAVTPAFSRLFATMWSASPAQIGRWLALSRADWLATALRLGLLALLFVLAKPRTRFASAALVCFTILDLSPYVNELAPRMPREYFTPPPVAAELQGANPQSRIFHMPERSRGAIARHYDADRSRVYWVIRNGMFPRHPAAWGYSTIFEVDIDLTNLICSSELVDAFWKKPPLNAAALDPFAAIANVEWLAVFRPPQPITEASAVRPVTFVRLRPSPRYYFAEEIVPVRSIEQFATELTGGRHRRAAAYVTAAGGSSGAGRVLRSVETPNAIDIDVETNANALLVASVTRDPHWHATIDGQPAEIEPVNIAFQAIQVQRGRHHVALRYTNPLVAVGGVITLIGLLVLAVLISPSRSATPAATAPTLPAPTAAATRR
ncbi:MAG TPA: YfhO family protein, partial [Thermoanaerobaculia bacterium]